MKIVVAEKPSVARDIALVLGANQKFDGYLEGNGYAVTWAIGHLLALAEPHEINPAWKKWKIFDLPLLPSHWSLKVLEKTKKQFMVVTKLLGSKKAQQVICATDAGREGELIFRYIYEESACKLPVKRLWISSLTPDAIQQGFRDLRDLSHYDGLADSAKGRSRADWLVGMNLSRLYSLVFNDKFSVGRVQTPTLAMIAEKDWQIESFVAEEYQEIALTFRCAHSAKEESYTGYYFKRGALDEEDETGTPKITRFPKNCKEAEKVLYRAKLGLATVLSLTEKKTRLPPPRLYDLTELQRHANRIYGFSAQKTLELAQFLYEKKKLISYPRTDSRYLTESIVSELPRIVKGISAPYQELIADATGTRRLAARFVDSSKALEHHAIIPTGAMLSGTLTDDQHKIFDLVSRRLLSAWHADHEVANSCLVTAIVGDQGSIDKWSDHYLTRGKRIVVLGWKILDPKIGKNSAPTETLLPSTLKIDKEVTVLDGKIIAKKTVAPPRFTDASLLTAMETAGSILDDKELSDAMREVGLGTAATRATMIETLIDKGYVIRNGKSLQATQLGKHLIEVVDSEVKSPVLTGRWEAQLDKIEKGMTSLKTFEDGIRRYLGDITKRILNGKTLNAVADDVEVKATTRDEPQMPGAEDETKLACSIMDLTALLTEKFGFASFRPHQQDVAQDVIAGHDLLLVMPTGSGKSLCYQLPGIARGGTTMVISPLISLIEDQVEKLKKMGFRSERIHSGMDRSHARQVCQDYLNGDLDFLFIAPERLGVRGFPELLAKRKPTLIAVDEAHCISHWGHDFRPDYRMLGERFPLLMPTPIIAMTATATALVQQDIQKQLNLKNPKQHVHGFRRENIAIEVVEMGMENRADAIKQFIRDASNLPMIVYTSTRKQAEDLADQLCSIVTVKAYHAGLPALQRSEVQSSFLYGDLTVITATTAFGMGVDKANIRSVIHYNLPGSVEAYYQEMGRAGRDQLPAKAVLFYSYADQKTHEFFHKKNYPDLGVIQEIYAQIPKDWVHRSTICFKADPEVVEIVLEKLWVHGGIKYTPDEFICAASNDWEALYLDQKDYKDRQLRLMQTYAKNKRTCRMLQLIQYFGDKSDPGTKCGLCDVCSPSQSLFTLERDPTFDEIKVMMRIGHRLAANKPLSLGRLFSEVGSSCQVSRSDFDTLLIGLARQKLIAIKEASFEKAGRHISYRTANLAARWSSVDETRLSNVKVPALAGIGNHSSQAQRKLPVKEAKRQGASKASVQSVNTESNNEDLLNKLRDWRLFEAAKRKVPAFCILPDRTLHAIALQMPKNSQDLLDVVGIGPAKADKFGKGIISIVHGFATSQVKTSGLVKEAAK